MSNQKRARNPIEPITNFVGQDLVSRAIGFTLDTAPVAAEIQLLNARMLFEMATGGVTPQTRDALSDAFRRLNGNSQFPPSPSVAPGNFFGGQCPGVGYIVTIILADGSSGQSLPGQIQGPIQSIVPKPPDESFPFTGWTSSFGDGRWNYAVRIVHGGGTSTVEVNSNQPGGTFVLGDPPPPISFTVQLAREDSLPDDCGNLSPIVNTNNYYYGNTINNFPALPGNGNGFNFNPTIGPINLPSPTLDFSPTVELPEIPDVLGGIGDILDGIGTILDAVNGNGTGSGNCLWNNGRIDLILEFLNNILTILQNWEEDGTPNGNPNLIPVTLNLDYVTEDANGERQLDNVQLTVIEPPNNLTGLFNQSAEIALTNSRLVRKIGAILGENAWTFNSLTDSVEYDASVEDLIRTYADESYNVTANNDGEITTFAAQSRKHRNIFQLILAGCGVLYMRGGLWKYPTVVKDSIVERLADTRGLDEIQDMTLHDQQQYNEWFLVQMEEILGNWHNKLVIKDIDPLTEGDQEQTIVLHSISDAFTELLTLEVANSAYLKALLNANTRLAMETVAIKKEAVCNKFMLDAILDYLGCNTQETKIELPTVFKFRDVNNPSAEWGLLDFLDTDRKEIIVTRYKDSKNFQFSLGSLLQSAAIVRGALGSKLPGSVQEFIDQFNADDELNTVDENNKTEFERFLDEVENQYQGTLDQSVTEPYGRPIDQRPRIVEIKPTNDEPNPF